MEKYAVLFNPLAGNGKGKATVENLRQILPEAELRFCDMTQIADYTAFFGTMLPEENLILAGGDGTLNRFINDTDGIEIRAEIYYVAMGSGNDFMHDVGEGQDGKPIRVTQYLRDLPRVTVKGKTYRFLNGVGYGIDGYCCEVGDRLRATSDKPVNYTSIAIKGLLFHYKPTKAEVIVDGKSYSYRKVWIAPTMNGRFYGGGMMTAPAQDRLNPEGTLSTVVLHNSGSLHTLMVFPSIFKGEHINHKKVVAVHVGKEITVRFDRPTALQIDGETIPEVTEYTAISAK